MLPRSLDGPDCLQNNRGTVAFRIPHRALWRVSLTIPALFGALGCGGGSSSNANSASAAQLTVNANALNFGSVAVGSRKNQSGSLAASGADVTISTASWNGQGYSLSGITFPVTVTAGASILFTVTFAPQTSGTTNGQVSFFSDAANSKAVVTLTGNGTQTHSVSLSWNASTSSVMGYNVYRALSGGQYTKLNPTLIMGLTFSDTAVQSGSTYDYAATSVDSSNAESAYSNITTVTIP